MRQFMIANSHHRNHTAQTRALHAYLRWRNVNARHPAVLAHLPDGSYLSDLDGLEVRIIEASVTVTGADGSRVRGSYRLITTLMDHRRFPAAAVVRLYHERWLRHEVAWSEWNSRKEDRLMSVT